MYYLNSRYYDPEIGRFISADGQINSDILGANLYAYCSDNPVSRVDEQGAFWDVVVDVGCTAYSVWQVLKDPKNPANWLALGADLACLAIPGVTGGGIIVRAASKADDVIDVGKTINRVDNAVDAGYSISKVDTVADLSICFVKGTKVLTEEGKKSIEDISPGDTVWSENPETGEKGLKEVVRAFVNETDELIHISAGNEIISATPEHPFYVRDRGWTGAIDLKAGDVLVLQDGGYIIVEKTQHEILETPVTVYNFEVEDFHTYYVGANSVLVHNTCFVKPELPINGITLNSTDALTLADNYLGANYSELSPGRFVSFDGLRQVRMTVSDLATINNHAGAPHLNFETLAPNPLKPGKFMITGNSHIFIFD